MRLLMIVLLAVSALSVAAPSALANHVCVSTPADPECALTESTTFYVEYCILQKNLLRSYYCLPWYP